MALRVVVLVACGAILAGCERDRVGGLYRDAVDPGVRYEFRDAGTWTAESVVEVASGMFPHGAGKRLEGNFTRRGDVLELVCLGASRQDPVSGNFTAEGGDPGAYSHRLLFEDAVLVPVGPAGEKDSLFASDLNPLGARKLVREVNP